MMEKPCYDCEWFDKGMCRMQSVVCPTLAKWEGHQEGYAAGREDMARELVDWIDLNWTDGLYAEYNLNNLVAWLKSKGVM